MRRISRGQLFAQLAMVANRDAAALRHDYEWPPVTPTDDEMDRANHLETVEDALWDKAKALGFTGHPFAEGS